MLKTPEKVKLALKNTNVKKEWFLKVYDSDGNYIDTITNHNLVSESITYQEKMCSADSLKFGLCEGSSLEFEYFNFQLIKDCSIAASLRIDVPGLEPSSEWESDQRVISIGIFYVNKCIKDQQTGVVKATCYNKANSALLDVNIFSKIKAYQYKESDAGMLTYGPGLFEIFKYIMSDYITIPENELTNIELTNSDTSYINSVFPTLYSSGEKAGKEDGKYLHVYSVEKTFKPSDYDAINYYKLKIYGRTVRSYIESRMADIDPYLYLRTYTDSADYLINLFNSSESYATEDKTDRVAGWYNFVKGRKRFPKNIGGYESEWLQRISFVTVSIPVVFVINTSSSSTVTTAIQSSIDAAYESFLTSYSWGSISELDCNLMLKKQINTNPSFGITATEITPRNLIQSYYEILCQNGKIDRTRNNYDGKSWLQGAKRPSGTQYPSKTNYPADDSLINDKFDGMKLNYGGQYPGDPVKPADTLYPDGAAEATYKSSYISLYTNSEVQQDFKNLNITYKTKDDDGNGTIADLQQVINSAGSTDYDMADNWMLNNLTWTEDEIQTIATDMAAIMVNLSWIPFELDAPGLPYLECGDQIEIVTPDKTFTSYILERTLSGIQNLEDTMNFGSVDTL